MSYPEQAGIITQSLEGHADHQYDGELNALHLGLTELGGLIVQQCHLSIQSITQKNLNSAEAALNERPAVNALALKADEKIVDLLAKHGPVAKDLRVIIAFSKAVADMQMISEDVVRIAMLAGTLHGDSRTEPSTNQLRDISTMGKLTYSFLEKAIDAFDTLNVKLARSILHCNEELEAEFESSLRRMTTFVLEDSRNMGPVIQITLVIKTLESLGEHIRNLAEYVIYLVEGIDMRYHRDNLYSIQP